MRTVTLWFKNDQLVGVKVGLEPRRDPKKVDCYSDALSNMKKNGWTFQTGATIEGEYKATWFKPDGDMDMLDLMLQKHDWTFDYSDSSAVWENGEAEVRAIREMVRKIGPEGKALVASYMKGRAASRSLSAYC